MGGWRIIRTLGRRVSDIQPVQGFAAETTSAAVILTSTHLGLPLSTTQVCTGSIFGAGAGRRLASVHWGMAGRIALALELHPARGGRRGRGRVVAGRDRHRRGHHRRGHRDGRGRRDLRRVAPQRRSTRSTSTTSRAPTADRRHRRLTRKGSSVHIDWATLVAVAVVAAAAALTVVLLVAFALVGLCLRPRAAGRSPAGSGRRHPTDRRQGHRRALPARRRADRLLRPLPDHHLSPRHHDMPLAQIPG